MARPLSFLFPLIGMLAAAPGVASPPAPSFTLYGNVRAESGRPLSGGEGTIIAKVAGTEITRGPTDTTLGRGINYTLQMPMDSGHGVSVYRSDALVYQTGSAASFAIEVIIGPDTYVPLAVAGNTVGEPSARRRLDIVLGIDADKDGLPDTWEQGLIDADGTGALRSISDVTANGDIDGDGLTNLQEFLAGTYALDSTNNVFIDVVGMNNGVAHLQFVTARGRTYSVQSSSDLKTWISQTISVESSGANPGVYYRAEDKAVVDLYAPGDPARPSKFFRLYVE